MQDVRPRMYLTISCPLHDRKHSHFFQHFWNTCPIFGNELLYRLYFSFSFSYKDEKFLIG